MDNISFSFVWVVHTKIDQAESREIEKLNWSTRKSLDVHFGFWICVARTEQKEEEKRRICTEKRETNELYKSNEKKNCRMDLKCEWISVCDCGPKESESVSTRNLYRKLCVIRTFRSRFFVSQRFRILWFLSVVVCIDIVIGILAWCCLREAVQAIWSHRTVRVSFRWYANVESRN